MHFQEMHASSIKQPLPPRFLFRHIVNIQDKLPRTFLPFFLKKSRLMFKPFPKRPYLNSRRDQLGMQLVNACISLFDVLQHLPGRD